MRPIPRIQDDRAGFISDVSDIIAVEAWKDPTLIPDLSSDRTLFLFSDYSAGKVYRTYSFYLFGRTGADRFNFARKELRRDFRIHDRRMSFKALNDMVKLKALPAFLEIGGAIDGLLITFAVDRRIGFMFANDFLNVGPEFYEIKKNVFENMLRIVHFGAQVVMLAIRPHQNIVWFTDNDEIVANERCEQWFGKLAQTIIRMMTRDFQGQIHFGVTLVDDGTLEVEDFASIPDLVAGALCETLGCLRTSGFCVTPRIVLDKPNVSVKTELICHWLGKSDCPLKKFGIVFDKTGSGELEWRPTFFRIRAQGNTTWPRCCGGLKRSGMCDPVRFDTFA